MPPSPRPAAVAALAVAIVVALAACTPPDADAPTPTPTVTAVARAPGAPATVLTATDAAGLAVQASEAFFEQAPLAVVAPVDETADHVLAASLGAWLGLPVLLAGESPDVLDAELERLGTRTVLAVGELPAEPEPTETPAQDEADDGAPVPEVVRVPRDHAALGDLLGEDVEASVVPADGAVAALVGLDPAAPVVLTVESDDAEPTAPPATPTGAPSSPERPTLPVRAPTLRVSGASALSDGTPAQLAAVGTARAAGADVVVVPGGDPRGSSEAIRALAEQQPTAVVGLGPAFGGDEDLAWRAATAQTGVELPGGTQLVFAGKMNVALYGTPGSAALGVLGEQGIPETIARAREHAARYEPYTDDVVVPSLEIIASIASAGAGPDGDYSAERPVAELRPLIDAAGEAGLYVVLDLQPGRTDFLTQARRYEELLRLPHVGLALDPEWRLAPDQVHLRQIGGVGIDEVNGVVTYLADLTRQERLPQKLLVLHQFRHSMLRDRARLDTSRGELAVTIHVDGQGTQPAKNETWRSLQVDAPNVYWGWKNFYDEDSPMLTPEQTMRIVPTPDLVTYQ